MLALALKVVPDERLDEAMSLPRNAHDPKRSCQAHFKHSRS